MIAGDKHGQTHGQTKFAHATHSTVRHESHWLETALARIILYTPVCTGTATFSICNDATFDTRLAVYFDTGACPPSGAIACSDNAPGCGQTSEVRFQV